jgi:hypothetical protein
VLTKNLARHVLGDLLVVLNAHLPAGDDQGAS